jgi:hypothetical protein
MHCGAMGLTVCFILLFTKSGTIKDWGGRGGNGNGLGDGLGLFGGG